MRSLTPMHQELVAMTDNIKFSHHLAWLKIYQSAGLQYQLHLADFVHQWTTLWGQLWYDGGHILMQVAWRLPASKTQIIELLDFGWITTLVEISKFLLITSQAFTQFDLKDSVCFDFDGWWVKINKQMKQQKQVTFNIGSYDLPNWTLRVSLSLIIPSPHFFRPSESKRNQPSGVRSFIAGLRLERMS